MIDVAKRVEAVLRIHERQERYQKCQIGAKPLDVLFFAAVKSDG
jgi:hypothetical protein